MDLNDPSLYLLSDIIETKVKRLKVELSTLPQGCVERKREIETQLAQYEHILQQHQDQIAKKLESHFQFSIEELYMLYGQYEDEYISIEFHHYSESARKYGRSISGILKYSRDERELLEKTTSQSPVNRTKDFVKIICDSKELSDDVIAELKSVGFNSGDIHKVFNLNLPRDKTFGQKGMKTMRNAIEIPFEYDKKSWSSHKLYVLRSRLTRGEVLIAEEIAQYCGISLHTVPNAENDPIVMENAFDDSGRVKPAEYGN